MKKQKRKNKASLVIGHQGLRTKPKIIALAIAQALALQAAQAASIEVTSSLDDNGAGCTLREAVTSFNTNILQAGCVGTLGGADRIIFAPTVSGSTITLALGNLNIMEPMSINPGGSDTTISGNDTDRVIVSSVPGVELTLEHLILTQGNAGAGNGGAVRVQDNTLNLLNTTISASTAGNHGGGLYAYNASVNLTDSTVSGNSAYEGGGIYVYDNSMLSLTTSTVSGNTTYYDGGGVYVKDHSTATLTDSTVSGNTSTNNDAGGIRVDDFSTLSLINSMVSGNSAYDKGGAIYIDDDSSATISNSTISDNISGDEGGGIYLEDGSVVLTDSTISSNSASEEGGGIHVDDGNNNTLTLINSTVSDNTSDLEGGGIYSQGNSNTTTVTLTNSTVSGNTATNKGGGIYIDDTELTMTNSTVSDNSAPVGGGLYADDDTALLINSIIANSLGGDDCEYDAATATVTAGPDSIIEVDSCGTGALNLDPGLMVLAANGGPTETHALMPGSPAIDGGDQAQCVADLSPLEDQRGVARDDGACDIGAYEFNATLIPIARKDRKMGSFMNGGEQWYSFNSTESQKLSMQTNGYDGDTLLEFYTGTDPKQVNPKLNMDDDSGPDLFSNIKHNVNSGPHLIRVKGKTDVIPYWLRLMSDKDILSFGDTASHFANKEIRVMSSAGITGGCGVNQYCPTDPVTRAQMAIFMLKAILGGNHNSPAATGSVFSDVSTSSFGANFIEEFSTLGITSGCGGGKYCPDLAVTREQMAVFLLRAWYGSSYTPPTATPAEINQFSDIANSFARDWIVQLTKENITGGCGGGKYCPTDTVTRGQMAAFIARTFSLDTEL